MTLSVVKRYLIAFDQYKWVGLATLAVTVGVSGVVALQPTPPPVYVATGLLRYDRPPVIFSSTTTKIQQEGQEITKEMLLDKEVIEAVAKKLIKEAEKNLNEEVANLNEEETEKINKEKAEKIKALAKKLADNVQIKMPSKNNDPNALIQVLYKDTNREKAKKVVTTLMEEMVADSEASNSSKLQKAINKINERLPKVTQELREAEKS